MSASRAVSQRRAVGSFYEVTSFGTVAENVAESLHKGDRVVVFGKGEMETLD
jgi:single-stranded DNA-binding protein